MQVFVNSIAKSFNMFEVSEVIETSCTGWKTWCWHNVFSFPATWKDNNPLTTHDKYFFFLKRGKKKKQPWHQFKQLCQSLSAEMLLIWQTLCRTAFCLSAQLPANIQLWLDERAPLLRMLLCLAFHPWGETSVQIWGTQRDRCIWKVSAGCIWQFASWR